MDDGRRPSWEQEASLPDEGVLENRNRKSTPCASLRGRRFSRATCSRFFLRSQRNAADPSDRLADLTPLDRLRHESSLLSPSDVCAEILALSVVEYTYTPSLRISIDLRRSGGKIHDNGRGIALIPDRGDTISHAERAHTCIYPFLSASPEVDAILLDLIWGARGAMGPALPAAACPSYSFVSEKDGEVWTQSYHYGIPIGAPSMLGKTGLSGTSITFETAAPIESAAVATLIKALVSRIPGLFITLRT